MADHLKSYLFSCICIASSSFNKIDRSFRTKKSLKFWVTQVLPSQPLRWLTSKRLAVLQFNVYIMNVYEVKFWEWGAQKIAQFVRRDSHTILFWKPSPTTESQIVKLIHIYGLCRNYSNCDTAVLRLSAMEAVNYSTRRSRKWVILSNWKEKRDLVINFSTPSSSSPPPSLLHSVKKRNKRKLFDIIILFPFVARGAILSRRTNIPLSFFPSLYSW